MVPGSMYETTVASTAARISLASLRLAAKSWRHKAQSLQLKAYDLKLKVYFSIELSFPIHSLAIVGVN